MTTILDSLTQALSPDAVRDIGMAVGLKPEHVSKGMGLVGPLLTTALATKASTGGGLGDLMSLVPKDGVDSILGNLTNRTGGGRGANLVSSLLGSGSGAIGTSLDRILGFRASSLLAVGAPLVLAVVQKVAAEKKLDATGVTNLLASEAADFQKSGGESVYIVRDVLDAGRHASEVKAKYSDVQWESVRSAPVAAASIVMLADKAGPVGVAKEIIAAVDAIDDARKAASPTSLVNLAFETDLTVDELSKFVKGRTQADALATVRDAIGVVERNSPGDAPTYRRLVADIAARVATASKEGGFLGIRRTLVSASEQAALDEIKAVTRSPSRVR